MFKKTKKLWAALLCTALVVSAMTPIFAEQHVEVSDPPTSESASLVDEAGEIDEVEESTTTEDTSSATSEAPVEEADEVDETDVPLKAELKVSVFWNDENRTDEFTHKGELLDLSLMKDGEVVYSIPLTCPEGNEVVGKPGVTGFIFSAGELDLAEYDLVLNNVPENYFYATSPVTAENLQAIKDGETDTMQMALSLRYAEQADIRVSVIESTGVEDLFDEGKEVKAELYARVDGSDEETLVKTYKFNASSESLTVIDNMPAAENGKRIFYTLKLESVKGYKQKLTVYDPSGTAEFFFDIEVAKPEAAMVTIAKDWEDFEDKNGYRPDSVITGLYANGELVGYYELKAEENWTTEIGPLPLYDEEGAQIEYTTEEIPVPYYTPEYEVVEEYICEASRCTRCEEQEVHVEQNFTSRFRPEAKGTTQIQELPQEQHVEQGDCMYVVEIGMTIKNTLHVEKAIEVKKVWVDDNNKKEARPDSIDVIVKANGEEVVTITLSDKNKWEDTVTGLAKYDENGDEIVYTIEEVAVKGYTTKVEKLESEKAPTYCEPDVEISDPHVEREQESQMQESFVAKDMPVAKGMYSILPPKAPTARNMMYRPAKSPARSMMFEDDIPLELGEPVEAPTEEGENKDEATDVEGEDANTVGKEATTDEQKCVEYDGEVIVETDRYVITNTIVKGSSIPVKKVWEGDKGSEDMRPEYIEVQLKANDKNVGEPVKLNKENDWSYVFEDLDVKDDTGKDIAYSVVEVNVPTGYEVKYDYKDGEYTITNTFTPSEAVEIKVVKSWVDDNNSAKLRPAEIKAQLFVNGQKAGEEVVLNAANNWSYTWSNLKKSDDEGKDYVYSVEEAGTVKNYKASKEVKGNTTTLINTLAIETIDFQVEKRWDDDNNKSGIRPQSVQFQLIANGKEVEGQVATLSASNNWKHVFKGLPTMVDGEKANYSIKEVAIPNGYTANAPVVNGNVAYITNVRIAQPQQTTQRTSTPTPTTTQNRPTTPTSTNNTPAKMIKTGIEDMAKNNPAALAISLMGMALIAGAVVVTFKKKKEN